MLWDPSYDTDKAIDEFCAAFYGPAAKSVRAYVTLIHQSTQKDPKLHVQIYTHPRNYVTPEHCAGQGALDQAESAVKGDATLLQRVQVARLPSSTPRSQQHRPAPWPNATTSSCRKAAPT